MRHRRDDLPELPEYEIRDVANAVAPAIAHREPDGKVIVEVDEKLRGRERAEAIAAALDLFRRGDRAAVPVPLFAIMWEAGARQVREHQRVAAAVAGAAAAAAVGASALIAAGALDDERPPAATPSIVHTITATPAPSAGSATPSQTFARPSPTRNRHTGAPPAADPGDQAARNPGADQVRPADAGSPTRAPTTAPSRSARPAPSRSPRHTSKPTERTTDAAASQEASPRSSSSRPRDASPTVETSRPPEPAAEPDPATQPTQPEPTPHAANCHLVEIELGDLVRVCL